MRCHPRLHAVLLLVVVAVAAAMRLPDLGRRPMHGDEAVQAFKLKELWEEGKLPYDPRQYHGPTLSYLTLAGIRLTGVADFAEIDSAHLRLVPVLFSLGTLLLLLLLFDGLGRGAALCAALLAALSPAMTFYSRYFIHESLLVFLTLAAIAAGWRFSQSGRLGWALLAGAALGLMHATKETCVIAFGCMAAALMIARVWGSRGDGATTPATRSREATLTRSHGDRTQSRARLPHIGAALLAAACVSALLYSGFFSNPSGPLDSLRAYASYLDRAGGGDLHRHPWHYYLDILLFRGSGPGPAWSEGLIVALAVVGAAATVARWGIEWAQLHFLRFLLPYALLMTAAYAVIPYKTPWCLLQFLTPLILLAGTGAVALLRWPPGAGLRLAAGAALLVAASHLGWQAERASHRFAADARNPYAYAQPHGDVARLGAWIDRLSAAHPDGRRMPVKVIAEDPWPLPWYLRRLEAVGYWEEPPEDPSAPVVIFDVRLGSTIEEWLPGGSVAASYGLRPGALLQVHVEASLLEAFTRTEEKPPSPGPAEDRR
ncbi:MAG: flippase activity-associated protein Agl23 [Planctomycetota bacterium]